MVNITGSETLFAERSHRSNSSMTARQAEILHFSFNKAGIAAHKLGTNYDALTKALSPIVETTIKDLKRSKDKVLGIATLEEVFTRDLQTIVSFGQAEKLPSEMLKRFYTDSLGARFAEISDLKNKNIGIINDVSFLVDNYQTKVDKISKEIKKYGIKIVDNFYRSYPLLLDQLKKIKSPDDLQLFQQKIEVSMKSKEDALLLVKISGDIKKHALSIADTKPLHPDTGKEKNGKEYSEFREALQKALDYLDFCYPGQNKSQFIKDFFVNFTKVRDFSAVNIPILRTYFASCPGLAKTFWYRRTNRKIEDPEKFGLTRQSVEKHQKHIYDKKLMSESGNWWFSRKADPNELIHHMNNPKTALIKGIKTFLDTPANLRNGPVGKNVNIMVIVNDNYSAKISIKPNASEKEILEALEKTNKNFSKPEKNWTEKKYRLRTESYKSTNRSQEYKEFYSHEAPLTIAGREVPILGKIIKKPIEGDYIFRLTTKTKELSIFKEKNSPFALFNVDSHKALIDINLTGDPEISIKYSHHHFDAANQIKVFRHYFENFIGTQNLKDKFEDENLPEIKIIDKAEPLSMPNLVFDPKFYNYPLFESVSSGKDGKYYQGIEVKIDENTGLKLNKSVVKDCVLALVNKASNLYTLYKTERNEIGSNPCHDNIQPALIALNPIEDVYNRFKISRETGTNFTFHENELAQVIKWLELTAEAIDHSKKGMSYQAVVSAGTGRLEDPIYKSLKRAHGPPSQFMEARGMTSNVVDKNINNHLTDFVTASSITNGSVVEIMRTRVLKDKKKTIISKKHAPKNLGAIGYFADAQEQSVSTCRKSPRNSQQAFADFFSNSEGSLFDGDKTFTPLHKQNTLTVINDLVGAWEDFTTGDMTFEKYQDTLNTAFTRLCNEWYCGKDRLVNANVLTPGDLQQNLNNVLIEDTKKTLSNEKTLFNEHKNLQDFFVEVQKAVISKQINQ